METGLSVCLCLRVADGDLYTGTVADFSGMDPIIYRESLQTEQYDSMSLNGEYCTTSVMFCFFDGGLSVILFVTIFTCILMTGHQHILTFPSE